MKSLQGRIAIFLKSPLKKFYKANALKKKKKKKGMSKITTY